MITRLRRWQLLRCIDSPPAIEDGHLARIERRARALVKADRTLTLTASIGAMVLGVSGFAGGFGTYWVLRQLGLPQSGFIPVVLIMQPVSLGFVGLLWYLFLTPRFRRHVRAAFVDCGIPVCVGCGYMLEGLDQEPECPECGEWNELTERSQC